MDGDSVPRRSAWRCRVRYAWVWRASVASLAQSDLGADGGCPQARGRFALQTKPALDANGVPASIDRPRNRPISATNWDWRAHTCTRWLRAVTGLHSVRLCALDRLVVEALASMLAANSD